MMLCQVLGQHWSATWACSVSQGLGHADKSKKFPNRSTTSNCFHQMRQCAPNNHILDLVVICMLSPLHMSLLHVALSLLGCVWPRIHLRLLYTTQTRATPGTVISRDCDPGLHHKPLITHELSWAHYMSVNTNRWDRECDHEWEKKFDWGREHMPDVRDTGREHEHEWAVWGGVASPVLRYALCLHFSLFISFLLTLFLGITDNAHCYTSIVLTSTITPHFSTQLDTIDCLSSYVMWQCLPHFFF